MKTETKCTDMQAGIAGEHLVCADLILNGYMAAITMQAHSCDVLAEINGKLYKIQVKTSRIPKQVPQKNIPVSGYIFHTKNGKGGRRSKYTDDQVDIFALVALDTKRIAYIPNRDMKITMIFRVPELRGTYHNEQGEEKRQQILKMKAAGDPIAKIKKELKTSSQMINYYMKNGTPANGGKKKGTYLDEFTLKNCLQKLQNGSK